MEIHFKQDNSLLNHFVGRRKELGQLHQSFLHQNMILVMGLRGIGKSTLIRMFLKKNHKKSVWISLEPSESKENFENGLFLAIKSHFQYSELGQDLQQLLEFLENQKIVLIIDDFQYLEEEFALNLLNQLRTTFYDSKSIIITNKRPKLNDLELLDLSAQTIKSLKEIDSKRLIKYFLNLHEHQKNIDTSLETLQQTLSGHPYVIKLYLSQLLQVNSIDESKFYQDIYTDLLQNIVASLDNNDLWKLKELSLIRKTMSKKVVVPLLGDSLRLLCNLFIVEFDVESRHYQIPVVLKRSLQSTMISAELVQAHSNIFSVLSHGNQRVSYEEVYYHAKEAKLWIQLIDYSLLQFEKHLLQGLDYFCIQEMYLDELLALDISYKKDQLYLYKCEYRITNVDSKGALEVIKVISCDKVALFCKTRLDSMKGNKKVAAKAFETCLLLDFSKGQKIIILFQLSYVYIHLKKLQKAESNLEVLKGHFKGLSEQGDYHCKSILASIKYNQQSYEEALILCFEMESYYQKSQNLYALGETQFYIICSYMGLEKYDQALLCCENHKLVLRKLKDDTSWFFYHSRLSIIYQKQGKMVFAVQEAKKAIDIARKKNWDLSLLLETYRLSLIYLDQKKFLEGQKYIEESLNLSQSLNRPDERALCIMTLAR
ncbi:ATP-binding protein, partial [bacterium]|nr:ATP-binding protein [bacterium]